MLGGGGEASYVASESINALDEGSTVAITLTTANVPSQTYYWEFVTISGTISGSDFVGGNSTGSFSTTIGTGSFNLTLAEDYSSGEGTESFQVRIRKDSNSGDIVATTNTITVTDTSTQTYSVTPSSANVNEGSSIDFVVDTNGVANSTTLYYTLTNLDAQDLSSGSLSGSFTISGASGIYNTGGSATVSFGISNDYHTEGADSFTFQLRTGSTSGTIVATGNATVNDTSTGTYSVTPSTTSITEDGGSVTFSIDTDPDRANATLYYSLESVQGTIDNNDFSSGTVTGSFTTNSSGNGSVSFTTQIDGTAGEQIFTFNVRLGSTTGRIVATSQNVTITETSTQISYQIFAGGGGGGGGVSSNVCGGGGGAGEYLSGNMTVTLDSPFVVDCGTGGNGGQGWPSGQKGSPSEINNVIAAGGGAGRGYSAGPPPAGITGGSGGGGNGGNGGPHNGGAGNPGGHPGFKGHSTGGGFATDYGYGGGGGGAGSGGPATTENKSGGSGTYAPLHGATICGGGGGGSNESAGGSGGPGGGGAGGGTGTADGGADGTNATPGSGSGGGGAAVRGTGPTYADAGNGSAGRVAISKPGSYTWGGFSGLNYSSPSPDIRIITSGSGTAMVSSTAP